MGVCAPVLQILGLFHTSNVTFHTRFQTWPLKKITQIILLTKRFLKIHFEFVYYFLKIYLDLKRHNKLIVRSYTPVFPRKVYPIPDQLGKIYTPF